jgi:hypothetical protein
VIELIEANPGLCEQAVEDWFEANYDEALREAMREKKQH